MDKFIALSDPTRRKIIEILCSGEHSSGDLAKQFECSAPAISQHLGVLKTAGLVEMEKAAQRRIYRLSREGFIEVDQWCEKVRDYWSARLESIDWELSSVHAS